MVKEKQKRTGEQANNSNKLLVAKIVKDTLTSEYSQQAVGKEILKTCKQANNPNKVLVKNGLVKTCEQKNNPNKLLLK